jgi:hypothetical protein
VAVDLLTTRNIIIQKIGEPGANLIGMRDKCMEKGMPPYNNLININGWISMYNPVTQEPPPYNPGGDGDGGGGGGDGGSGSE